MYFYSHPQPNELLEASLTSLSAQETQGESIYNPEGSEWATICQNCAEPYLDPNSFVKPLNELTDTEDDEDKPLDIEDEVVDFDVDDLVMMQRDMYKTVFSDMGLCFVCLQEEDPSNLVEPCGCKGTMQYAHEECFFQWQKRMGKPKCPFCDKPFGFRPKKKGWFSKGKTEPEAAVGSVFQGTRLTRMEVFKKATWLNIKETHPLLMCLLIPPADAFTRPQRLTVLLATIFGSLFSTALIMASAPPQTIPEKVIAALVTTLAVLPVTLVFKGIFTIGQGPKESAMSEIRKDNRETPWMRQERMLLEIRYNKAKEKAMNGNPADLLWIAATGGLPKKVKENKNIYSKGMLDQIGERNIAVDICKCIAWGCALGYLLCTGLGIVFYSLTFTPNTNAEWLGLGWLTIVQEWVVSKPLGAVVGGGIAAMKDDMKGALKFAGEKLEYCAIKVKQWAERKGHHRLARCLPVSSDAI